MRIASFALAVLGAASFVPLASGQVVMALDSSRCFQSSYGYWLTGSSMVGPHAQLIAAGYSVQETAVISSAALANVDVFVLALPPVGATLPPSEITALQAFVSGGGGLLFIGENDSWVGLDGQLLTAFSAGTYAGSGSATGPVTIAAPTHPVISGPAGIVGQLPLNLAPGAFTPAASGVTSVIQFASGATALLALSYGSGSVVMLSDSTWFMNPPNFTPEAAVLWANTIDWLDSGSCSASIANYCTSSTTSHGCVPSLAASGSPSASASSGFTLTCDDIEGQRTGLFFYGTSGELALPWASGSTSFLCVKPPTQRTAPQNSGGSVSACDGSLALDLLAFFAANPSALGQPLTAGQQFNVQCWFRDPPAVKTTNLSDGLRFTLCP